MAVSHTTEALSYICSFGTYYLFVYLATTLRWDLRAGVVGRVSNALVGSPRPLHTREGEGTKSGTKAAPATTESLRQRAVLLLTCIVGIQISYLCWGLMQERIMTRTYDEERFRSSKFLVFSNRLAALVLADVVSQWEGAPPDTAPPVRYSYCATSNIVSSLCQYEALKYVSFPTQVLAKSCKMVPVMIMGYAVSRRSYPINEWLVAFAVTAGMVLFKLNEVSDKMAKGVTAEVGLGTEMLGYGLIGGYMAFDSFTSNWQEALFKDYPVTPVQMMRQVNLFSAAFTALGLVITSEAFEVPAFLSRHPDCFLHVVIMSVCSAVGQLFIFLTIKQFGALVFVTVNTVRTLLSVLLSFLVFGHAMNSGEAMGIGVVFLSLGAQVYRKWSKQAKKVPTAAKANTAADKAKQDVAR